MVWGLTSDSLDYIYTWTVRAFYVVENIEINPLNRKPFLTERFFCFSRLLKRCAAFLSRNVKLLIFILFGFRCSPVTTGYNGYRWWIMLQNIDLLYRRARGISAAVFAFSFSSHAWRLSFVFKGLALYLLYSVLSVLPLVKEFLSILQVHRIFDSFLLCLCTKHASAKDGGKVQLPHMVYVSGSLDSHRSRIILGNLKSKFWETQRHIPGWLNPLYTSHCILTLIMLAWNVWLTTAFSWTRTRLVSVLLPEDEKPAREGQRTFTGR